jgi:hypothetical protein
MSIEIIVAATGILGVMASTLVQLYLGRQQEARKKIIETRAQAYMDLVNAVGALASQGANPDTNEKLLQAKSRAAVVGSDGVVKAIGEFWGTHGGFNTPEGKSSFTLIIAVMRKDLSGKNSLPNNLLEGALFN